MHACTRTGFLVLFAGYTTGLYSVSDSGPRGTINVDAGYRCCSVASAWRSKQGRPSVKTLRRSLLRAAIKRDDIHAFWHLCLLMYSYSNFRHCKCNKLGVPYASPRGVHGENIHSAVDVLMVNHPTYPSIANPVSIILAQNFSMFFGLVLLRYLLLSPSWFYNITPPQFWSSYLSVSTHFHLRCSHIFCSHAHMLLICVGPTSENSLICITVVIVEPQL